MASVSADAPVPQRFDCFTEALTLAFVESRNETTSDRPSVRETFGSAKTPIGEKFATLRREMKSSESVSSRRIARHVGCQQKRDNIAMSFFSGSKQGVFNVRPLGSAHKRTHRVNITNGRCRNE